jgi:lysophospholipase L1-like esterase
MKRLTLLALVALSATAVPAPAQKPEPDDGKHFFFKDGDTIVIMGDSITEQMLYSNYLEMWSTVRFPKRNLTFRNVGIGGDKSPGGNARFARDVLAHKATVLTVDFGMNDGYSKTFSEQAFQTYLKGLQGIADQAKKAKIRVAWITPQPIEPRAIGPALAGVNDTLERFSAGVEQIAHKNDGIFVDQFHPYLAVLARARSTDPKNINITGGDPVHPGPPGQVVMAAAILRRLDFQRLVSRVAIDGEKVMTENCDVKIGSLSQPNSVTFTRLDFGLPFFPEEAKSILQWTPLRDDMNRYWLQVKGLKAGTYAVQLNGTKVAEYSAEELAKGVNMAAAVLASGPIADQVKKIWTAVQAKNRYFHDQVFRGVVLAPAKSPIFKDVDAKELEAKRQEVYAERMKKMPELDAAVRAELVLKPHTVTVAPAK